MDRRLALRAGVLGSGAFLLGKHSFGEITVSPTQLNEVPGDTTFPYAAGHQITIDTHEIIDNDPNPAATGFEDWGSIGRGIHLREFRVPPETRLVLGHVQEAGNYGSAIYETMGIAINPSVWTCRVIWRMDWDQAAALPTYFHWARF